MRAGDLVVGSLATLVLLSLFLGRMLRVISYMWFSELLTALCSPAGAAALAAAAVCAV